MVIRNMKKKMKRNITTLRIKTKVMNIFLHFIILKILTRIILVLVIMIRIIRNICHRTKKKGKKKTYIEKQEDYGKNYKYKTRNEYDKTNNESYKNQNFNDSAHNLISNYEKCIQLNDKRKEIKMEQYRIMNYIKKNEIKEKIRNKKRKKIHSVYLMYEKTYKINKSKLNYFYIFLRLTKNIKHEYIINPNYFEGYVEIYLSLIPTDHGERPFSRCFSSWGIQRRSQNEFDECLPKISVFVTLKNMKIIFSDKQMSNLIKWLNLNFVTYSTWKAGILSQFEKPKATPNEEMCYINKWVLKLLDTHSSKEEKEDAEKYCELFENTHSIHIINLLRTKAFSKLQELRKDMETKMKPKQ